MLEEAHTAPDGYKTLGSTLVAQGKKSATYIS